MNEGWFAKWKKKEERVGPAHNFHKLEHVYA